MAKKGPISTTPAIPLSDIPGLDEAMRKASALEQELWERAFLDVNVTIAGIEVRQMKLRHYILAEAAALPIFSAELMEAEECAMVLWIVSPRYRVGTGAAVRRSRTRFFKAIAGLGIDDVRAGIAEYVRGAFMDAPLGAGGSLPATCLAAALIDRLVSSGYAWSEEAFLDAPLGRLFQYLKRCVIREDPRAVPLKPLSDKVRGEFVRAHLPKVRAEAAAAAAAENAEGRGQKSARKRKGAL